ncbi:hypothetical protein KUCAC02_011164, partial [Chaenocephalus aceratus]
LYFYQFPERPKTKSAFSPPSSLHTRRRFQQSDTRNSTCRPSLMLLCFPGNPYIGLAETLAAQDEK